MITGIAVDIKIFSRVDKLSNLLDSIRYREVETVYIADDGENTEERSKIYTKEYPFRLMVFKLQYDAGPEQCRAHIIKNLSEECLLIVDSDHRLPQEIVPLRTQIQTDESIGGVSELLHETNRIVAACHDLCQNDGPLIRDVRERNPVHIVGGHPFVPFDFILNVAMFRKECLDEYCWDSEYVIRKEHLDFYTGHSRNSDWIFSVYPTVLFGHDPGGDTAYIENRQDRRKLLESRGDFIDKWGYRDIVLGYTEWNSPPVHRPALRSLLKDVYKNSLLSSLSSIQKFIMGIRNWARHYRHCPHI